MFYRKVSHFLDLDDLHRKLFELCFSDRLGQG